MWQHKLNQCGCAAVLATGVLALVNPARGQETDQTTTTLPATAMAPLEAEENPPPLEQDGKRYNVRVGKGGLNLSAGVQLRYVDNVFLANTGRKDDYVISPEADLAAYFPIGISNALAFDVSITYYEYTKNSSLNSGIPIINPNTELAFQVQTGDFTLRPSEAFSYQENPVYQTGGQFFNVENTGRLARFDNRAGLGVKWDLNDLVVNAGYVHENLWANDAAFDYINHVSELLNADAMLSLSPRVSAGLETWGSLNTFANNPLLDSWRVRGGPGFRWQPTDFIRVRLGGGYERIDFNSGTANVEGINPLNSFYAYARVEHQLSQVLSQSLEGSHDNQLGYNAGNLEGYHIIYSLNWKPWEPLTLSPLATMNFYHEAFGTSVPGLYNERFDYPTVGVTAAYQIGEHWRANLSWGYVFKDSNLPGFSYQQNQAAVELLYAF